VVTSVVGSVVSICVVAVDVSGAVVVAWVVDSVVVSSFVVGDEVTVVASGPGRQLVSRKVERTRVARIVSVEAILLIGKSSLILLLHLLAKPFFDARRSWNLTGCVTALSNREIFLSKNQNHCTHFQIITVDGFLVGNTDKSVNLMGLANLYFLIEQ